MTNTGAAHSPGELPVLAVITPCYNEQEVLPQTLDRLTAILEQLIADRLIDPTSYVACVDDGSRDQTWSIITSYQPPRSGQVKGIKLSRNFGHQNALIAGLTHCDFDASITIDADLQDPPEAMIEMVKRYVDGYDIVYGVRNERSTDTWFKRTTAESYYRLMRAFDVDLVMNHADFRLLSDRVVQALLQYKESSLFLRGIIPCLGFSSSQVCYARAKRTAGETKYPLQKMLKLAGDGLMSFSTFPLSLITLGGIAVCFAALILSIWVATTQSENLTRHGWMVLTVGQYWLSGFSILFTGIIGHYLGRIYREVKARPRFIIAETFPDRLPSRALRHREASGRVTNDQDGQSR